MNLAILTSGGDAPGMNAAIRGFVRRGLADGHTVFGIPRGFEGLIHAEPHTMTAASVANILMTGGTILKTSRFLDFHQVSIREMALDSLKRWQIDAVAVLGGNGSLAGANTLSESGFPIVGIPASIDNDIAGTDYSLGFDTAVNNIVSSIDKIRDTASSHERIFVVQVMGNRSGNLAIAAGLACGAEAIIIPEQSSDYPSIEQRLLQTYARGKKHSFVIVAEGAGEAKTVAEELAQRTGREAKWAVLGHTQRGGPPTSHDRILAALFADKAVDLLTEGKGGFMVSLCSGSITSIPLVNVIHGQNQTLFHWQRLAELLAR